MRIGLDFHLTSGEVISKTFSDSSYVPSLIPSVGDTVYVDSRCLKVENRIFVYNTTRRSVFESVGDLNFSHIQSLGAAPDESLNVLISFGCVEQPK